MDQVKTGRFIKALRTEKRLTQEQLAERFGVTRRSVSRWETGSNLPELDILLEMTDFFGVGLRELLTGERETAPTPEALEQTAMQIAEISDEEKKKITKRMHLLFLFGLAASLIFTALFFCGRAENSFGGLCLGITMGMMLFGVIMTSRHASKLRALKLRLLRRNSRA